MILYKRDWIDKHPGAIADTKTTNDSFRIFAAKLVKMGVKNAAFCLALHNPRLQGVDPFDPNLTDEQLIMIGVECEQNPWYFFREIVRVPAAGAAKPVKFNANRGNMSLYWLFFNHVTTLLIQPRQTGKSLSTDVLMVWLMMVGATNTNINLLTKDDTLRVANVKRIKDIMSELPSYLKLRDRNDTNNTEKITVNANKNSYITNVAQNNPKSAYNIGRGMTFPINQVDEIAFVNYIEITLPAMLPASGAARDSAKVANAPYGNIFTTTPGFTATESGKYVYEEIYLKAFRWNELLFDVENEEELYAYIKKNSSRDCPGVLLEYNHRQLGYTDEWLAEKIASALSKGENAGADFLNIWAKGSDVSPLSKQVIKTIQDSITSDSYTEISKSGYITRWYIPEKEVLSGMLSRKLILGLDTSDAVGKDDIALCIRDSSTGETLGVGIYNETNLVTFSEWIADLIIRFSNLTLVIERRSSGVMIIDNLLRILPLHNIDPFRRIFNWLTNDCNINKVYMDTVMNVSMNRRDSSVYIKYRHLFGFATSGSGRQGRDQLYGGAFMASTKYTGNVVRDSVLANQIISLRLKNGRIDHGSDNHDDLVVAWLLPYWFLTEANNKGYYGLNTSQILSSVNNVMIEEQGGKEAIEKKAKQNKLKMEIERLVVEYKSLKNPLLANLAKNKIKHLYKQLDTSMTANLNIDAFIENIAIDKKRNSA